MPFVRPLTNNQQHGGHKNFPCSHMVTKCCRRLRPVSILNIKNPSSFSSVISSHQAAILPSFSGLLTESKFLIFSDAVFFTADVLTCHGRQSTGGRNLVNNASDPSVNQASEPACTIPGPKWSAAIFNAINYSCVVPAMTCLKICPENSLLRFVNHWNKEVNGSQRGNVKNPIYHVI